MKKLVFLFCAVLLFFSSFSFAQVQSDSTAIIALLQKLDKAGYQRIHEIEYKHGIFQIEAYNTQCHKVRFRVSAQSTKLPPLKETEHLSMLQIAERVQAAGYVNMYEIEFDNGHYEVKAYNENGYKIKLYVDPKTGQISKGWV